MDVTAGVLATLALAATMAAAGALEVAHAAPEAPGVTRGRGEVETSGDESKEYRVKAALLFNLVKYTTFPASAFQKPEDPIVILVVGKDPFGSALEATFDGKSLHGRSFKIERSATLPKALTAHVVFASAPSAEDAKQLIALSKDHPCLLVGEHAGFAQAGAYVNFYEEKGKVRLEVNTDRKADTKLELSAELLKLAKIVKSGDKEATR